MSLGVNHLKVLKSQPTDRDDKLPVPQCLAALLSACSSATTGLLPYGVLYCSVCGCVCVREWISAFVSGWIGA